MALDDHIRILSGVRLFAGFTQDQLRLLAFGAEAMNLPAGRKLFKRKFLRRDALQDPTLGGVRVCEG